MFLFSALLLQTQVQDLVSYASRTKSKKHMTIDSVREFRELTEIKIKSKVLDYL